MLWKEGAASIDLLKLPAALGEILWCMDREYCAGRRDTEGKE